jgi:photosystem II stability/assembly factor-like uncharacterized protein
MVSVFYFVGWTKTVIFDNNSSSLNQIIMKSKIHEFLKLKIRFMSKKLLLLFLLLPAQMFAQYYWQTLPNAPKTDNRIDDIYFINPNVGWAIVPPFTNHNYGQVYRTLDGGNTWKHMSSTATWITYRSVGFKDAAHGWVGSLCTRWIAGDTIPLYYTADSGHTFTPVHFPNPKPTGICGISVVSDSVIYAYGRYLSNNPCTVFAKTIDGGTTWTTQSMAAYADSGLVDGWFWNKDSGFITGSQGLNSVILRTNDGGNTWQTVYTGTHNDTSHVWKIYFPSHNIGYGSVEPLINVYDYDSLLHFNTYFVKTTDGGQTWTEHPFIYGYDEEGCGFLNDTVGWIGGWSGYSYITYDGGNTWKYDSGFGSTIPIPSGLNSIPNINRFRKFGDTLMYASGNTVYKLDKQYMNGVHNIQSSVVPLNNYPNPFTQETEIEFTLPEACNNVEIQVYNVYNEKVYSHQYGSMSSGLHKFIYDSHLVSGVYYCKLVAGKYTVTRKIVKLR